MDTAAASRLESRHLLMPRMRVTMCFIMLTLATIGFALHPLRVDAHGAEKKVVSLAPNLTELLFALELEDHLAGRSSACDEPPAVLHVPVLGAFGRPNLEAILDSGADLVLVTDLERPAIMEPLAATGVDTMVLPCESWDDLMEAALQISDALHHPGAGQAWVSVMNRQKDALVSRVNEYFAGKQRPRVYLEIWHDPIMSAGAKSFVTELIELAGGSPIGKELDTKYSRVSSEWVVRRDPDVIVLAYMNSGSPRAVKRLARRPGWSGIKAIRKDNVCASIPADWLLRPGPRCMKGAEALAEYFMRVSLQGEDRPVLSSPDEANKHPAGSETRIGTE